MHIELIGSTSAGKTTLARKMAEAGKSKGLDISLSDDFVLEQLQLNWIKSEFVRRRWVELAAYAICIAHLSRYRGFLRFVLREGKSSPGSWLYKIHRIRNVIRKVGIFEFISTRSGPEQIVLADNEGILQGVHNLFVHQSSQVDLRKIVEYVELVPLPDIVLYIDETEEVLVSRTVGRGHARISGSSPELVVPFIRQAIAVFSELARIPKVQERLLIVQGGSTVRIESENILEGNLHRVIELVQSGC